MPKKQGFVRGGDTPTPTKEQSGYSSKIPTETITVFESELTGLLHGTAILTIHVRDGQLTRYTISREHSHLMKISNGE
jgi:hypothetical protein